MRVLLVFSVGEEKPYVPLMVKSVREHLPNYRIVHLTDFETPDLSGADEVVRRFKDPDVPIFVFRTEHFVHCPYEKWLALDADVLVKRDVEDVWARNFDVALTTRRSGPSYDTNGVDVTQCMPFNTGVVFSRNPEFWRKCQDRMTPPYEHGWYTDQYAVADTAQTLEFHVLVLPGDEFNWTPYREDETSSARIWHYKGNRKDWMMRA